MAIGETRREALSGAIVAAALAALPAAACTHHPEVSPWDESEVEQPIGEPTGELPAFGFPPAPPGAVTEPGELRGRVCGTKRFQIHRELGQIMIVLDRSGSMSGKWNDVTNAVLETVRDTQAFVMWGLMTFPAQDGPICAAVETPDVPFDVNNHPALSTRIPELRPGGTSGSPVRAGVASATRYLKSLSGEVPRYIVLATDGAPNCRDDKPGSSLDVEPTIKAVREAAAAGFHTFVVGIAAGSEYEGVLSDIAEAGLEARPNATTKYWPVKNRAELATLLRSIATRLSDCIYPLEMVPPDPERAEVKVDGVRLRRDPTHKDGWDYLPGMSSIRIYGPTCERLSQPGGPRRDLEVRLGCAVPFIP
jgi:hypothetical protein